MAINPGYIGLCQIDGLSVRVNNFTVNVRQEVQFYEHIIGLRDSIPSGLKTKKDDGSLNIQRTFWRPGVKIVSGGITFPATVASLKKVFDLAKNGDDFTINFTYSCNDVARTYKYCKVNSFTFTVVAGEIANIQLDIMGRHIKESNGSSKWTSSQKLLTWDEINIKSISKNPVQQFAFTVNNNCIPIYTAGSNDKDDLFPKKIRVGMQEVTGSLVYFVKGVTFKDLDYTTRHQDITITIKSDCGKGPSFDEDLCVIYKPIERASSLTALLHTLPFVGVGKALGT